MALNLLFLAHRQTTNAGGKRLMDISAPASALGGFLENNFGEHYLPSVNRDAFNTTGADIQFARQYKERLAQDNTFYVISGSDSGLLIRWLLKQGLAAGSTYLFVEPAEVLPLIHCAITDLGSPDRVGLCALDDWKEAAAQLGLEPYLYIGRVVFIRSIGAQEAYYTPYLEFDRALKGAVDHDIWHANTKLVLFQHMETQLANIPDNYQTTLALHDCLKGFTGVVLAGGPSLDEILPWVKANREQLFVIAVSRISNRLQDVGIQPDIVVSIDPTSIDFAQVRQMLLFNEDTVFIHGFHATAPLVAQWPGRTAYVGPLLPWASTAVPDNLPQYGPTVTNAALHIAIEVGCTNIVLAGVDLCFSQDGFTHAQGSYERNAGPMLSLADQIATTYGGWEADTKNEYLQAGRMIEKLAQPAKQRGVNIYNASLNALRLDGVEHIEPAKIALNEPRRPAREILREVIPEPTSKQLNTHYKTMLQELQLVTRSLREIRALADEALECNAHLFGRDGHSRDFRYKHRMDGIEETISQTHTHLDRFIKGYALSEFARILRPQAAGDWSDAEVEAAGNNYYRAYQTACDRLIDKLDAIIRNLQMRRLEQDNPANVTALMDYWQENQQPGRALLWARRHPEQVAALPAAIRDRLESMQGDFRASLTHFDPDWQVAIGNWSNLNGIQGRAKAFFQQKDAQGLQRLLQTLAQSQPQSQERARADQLEHLVQGHLAQLQGKRDAALDAYAKITDSDLQEDKLLQTALLHLDRTQLDAARSALDTLCSISPVYIPFHADLLRTLGDVQGALEAYADYLEFAPTDIAVLLKLGQLYAAIQVTDGAQICYNTVLEIDPDNVPARRLLQQLEKNSAAG